MAEVEFTNRAVKDMRRIGAADRAAIYTVLERLQSGDESVDDKALKGLAPWRRLRAGSFRVLFCPATARRATIIVARVVNRRDLERAAKSLDR